MNSVVFTCPVQNRRGADSFDRIWPAAFAVFGVIVMVVWVSVLGYGVVKLIERIF